MGGQSRYYFAGGKCIKALGKTAQTKDADKLAALLKKAERKPPSRHWGQDDVYDDLDLPNDDFDYDKFCAKEFGIGPAHKQIGIRCYWWLTGVVLLGWFFYCLGKYWLLIGNPLVAELRDTFLKTIVSS